jgi:hypothetical protein
MQGYFRGWGTLVGRGLKAMHDNNPQVYAHTIVAAEIEPFPQDETPPAIPSYLRMPLKEQPPWEGKLDINALEQGVLPEWLSLDENGSQPDHPTTVPKASEKPEREES